MPFEQRYFAEHRLILVRVTGNVSLTETHNIGCCLQNTLDQLDAEANLLLDLHALDRYPTSITDLGEAMVVLDSPKLGWFVLLTGENAMLKFIATVMVQLKTRSARFRIFERPETVISFLQGLQPAERQRSEWLADLRRSLS